jgi:hypothetical protein
MRPPGGQARAGTWFLVVGSHDFRG